LPWDHPRTSKTQRIPVWKKETLFQKTQKPFQTKKKYKKISRNHRNHRNHRNKRFSVIFPISSSGEISQIHEQNPMEEILQILSTSWGHNENGSRSRFVSVIIETYWLWIFIPQSTRWRRYEWGFLDVPSTWLNDHISSHFISLKWTIIQSFQWL
jgi:hypothetical protein